MERKCHYYIRIITGSVAVIEDKTGVGLKLR